MSERSKQFLNDVLDRKNSIINEIFKDLNSQERFQSIIKDLNLTEQTFECGLKEIAALVLSDSMNNGCFVSLLIFSMELDSFHSVYSAWYRRDMLIETLHKIFLESSIRPKQLYKKEDYYFWEYTLILFVCSVVLILF